MASSGNQFKLWAARAAAPVSTSLVFSSPTPNESPYTAAHAPVYREAFVCMSPTVAQNDEMIDVQLACGTPYTPEAASVTVSGPDAIWFDSYLNSQLVFKASTRASVPRGGYLVLTVNATNANGSSDQSTLWVWVPATGQGSNGEVFVSFTSGSDAGAGTVASPYKHCPGTSDWTGGAFTPYSQGQTIFFEGGNGSKHQASLTSGLWPNYPGAGHTGTLSNPFRYAFMGWKGQAKFTGVKDEAGSWGASGSEAWGSPSLANLTTLTVTTAVERWQPVFWQSGEIMGRLAQYPRPTNLRKTQGAQAAADGTNNYNGTTSDGGMKQVFYTTNSGDTTPVRFYYAPGGTSCYIQDAALDAHFNNASITYNAAGVGLWLQLWFGGNNVDYVNVLGYDVTTHRVTFDAGTIQTSNGYTAYALLGSPYDVQVSTQYAMSLNGLQVIAYRPASPGQAGVSRLHVGGGLGTSNVAFHQSWFEGYSGATVARAGYDASAYLGGVAFKVRTSSAVAGVSIYGCKIRCCNNDNEEAIFLDIQQPSPSTTAGLDNPILDRLHYSDNLRGQGIRATGCINGVPTGTGPGGFPTKAEVAANSRGKARWWFVEEDGMTRTMDLLYRLRGMEFAERVVRNFDTVHGDGDAWYLDATATTFTDHNWCHGDFADNVLRWKTTSTDPARFASGGLAAFGNWYDGWAISGAQVGSNVGISLFAGDPNGIYTSGIFMQSDRSTSTPGLPAFSMNQGFLNMTVQSSVLNGVTTTTGTTGAYSATWTLDHNGLTVPGGFPANDAANSRLVTNTTTLTTQQTWDGLTIPTAWKAILRAGAAVGTVPIGPFPDWKV